MPRITTTQWTPTLFGVFIVLIPSLFTTVLDACGADSLFRSQDFATKLLHLGDHNGSAPAALGHYVADKILDFNLMP